MVTKQRGADGWRYYATLAAGVLIFTSWLFNRGQLWRIAGAIALAMLVTFAGLGLYSDISSRRKRR